MPLYGPHPMSVLRNAKDKNVPYEYLTQAHMRCANPDCGSPIVPPVHFIRNKMMFSAKATARVTAFYCKPGCLERLQSIFMNVTRPTNGFRDTGFRGPNHVLKRECQICKKRVKLSSCAACRCVYYCSVKCQKTDWKKHKKECEELKEILEK